VRIAPGRGMTSKELAEVFHCSAESMKRSIETMKKYGIITGKDGQYFILSLRKKKRDASPETLRETLSETIRERHNYNNYNLYNNKNNKNINYNYGPPENPETGGTVPPAETEPGALIPLEQLDAPYRNIVEAWNKLKHKPFAGLYPPVAESLKELLERYSEETIVSTIAGISQSPFLLGKNNTPNRWSVTFTWLLKPDNFEKLRSGQYHKTPDGAGKIISPACAGRPGNPLLAEMARALGETA